MGKEFEKWFSKVTENIPQDKWLYQPSLEDTWKAALKWLLEESKRFDYTGLTEVIEDELDGKDYERV